MAYTQLDLLKFLEIQQTFINRKKELLKYENPSILNVESLLISSNIYYVREKAFFDACGNHFYADFYIPFLSMAIEIDGGYHSTDRRVYLDNIKEDYLLSDKLVATLRMTNEEAFELTEITHRSLLMSIENKLEAKRKDFKYKWDIEEWLCRLNPENKIHAVKVLTRHVCPRIFSKNDWKNKNSPVLYYDRKLNIIGIFENIFVAHLKMETKFKDLHAKIEKGKLAYSTVNECIDLLKSPIAKESFRKYRKLYRV